MTMYIYIYIHSYVHNFVFSKQLWIVDSTKPGVSLVLVFFYPIKMNINDPEIRPFFRCNHLGHDHDSMIFQLSLNFGRLLNSRHEVVESRKHHGKIRRC